MELIKDLILNLSVIIVLSFLSGLIYEKFHTRNTLHTLLQILVFSLIISFSILNPVIIHKYFQFDGRTILVLISTLFFGWKVGFATVIVSIIVRLTIGNVFFPSIILPVLIPFLIGWLFNYLISKNLYRLSVTRIYLIALLNSLSIFIALYFIQPISIDNFLFIQRVAIIIFPILTTIVGLVILSSINKISLHRKILEDEARLKATFHSIDEGLIILSLEGKIEDMNNAFKGMLGIVTNEFNGRILSEIIKVNDFDTDIEIKLNFEKDAHLWDIYNKKVYIKYNNFRLPAIIYLTDITNKLGQRIGYVFVIRDITKEIEDQEIIISSERTFRGIFNSLQEAIYIQDQNGIFIDVNDGAIKMYGYDKKDFIGNTPAFLSADKKNDNLDLQNILKKAFHGEPQIFEFWGRKKDGTVFPKIVSFYPGEYFGKKVIIAVAIDISNIKLAQEKLFEQEQILRTLINATPDIIYVKCNTGKWLEANKEMLELLDVDDFNKIKGLSNDSLISNKIKLRKTILLDFEKIEDETWAKKSTLRVESEITLPNGIKKYFDIISIPIFEQNDVKKNLVVIGRDVTERKKEEEEKQIMLNKLSSVVENFDGAVLLEDNFGKIELVNDNFLKIFKIRLDKSKIISSNSKIIFDLIKNSLTNQDYFNIILDDIANSITSDSHIEIFTTDNRIIETNHFKIMHDNIIVNHLWIFRDITKSKTNEEKMKSQINELERFNKVLVERELKMIELKKEVNDLLVKSGFSPKYNIIE